MLADKEYQGIKNLHSLSYTLIKKRTVCAEISRLVKTEQADEEEAFRSDEKRI